MTHDEQNNSSDAGTKVPMNHDELLAKIHNALPIFDANNPILWSAYKEYLNALRAVVELHKPYVVEHYWADGLETKAQSFCTVCVGKVKSDSIFHSDVAIDVYYPCPTIQTIETELI